MNDIHLIYYDEKDYDIDAMYNTIKVLQMMNHYDHLDEPIEEVYFAGFFGRRSDEGTPYLFCNCRQIWAYPNDEDKVFTIINAFGNILHFIEYVGAIAFQKDQCMFHQPWSSAEYINLRRIPTNF